MQGSQASSATSHFLTPQGPTWPAQTLATGMLPQVPPSGEAAHSPRGAAEQPPDTHALPARSAQGCLQPVLHLLDLPPHRQDPTGALRRECFTRASPRTLHPPFPRPYPTTPPSRCPHCSRRARVALRSSTTLCPGWEQRLCMLWRSPTSKTLNTAGCCHAHGLFPYRDGTPPRQGPRKTLCSGAPSTIHQSFNTGRDMVADATDTVPRVQHGPLGFGQSWRTRDPHRPGS